MSTTDAIEGSDNVERFFLHDQQARKIYVVKDRAMMPQVRAAIARVNKRCEPDVPSVVTVTLAEIDNLRSSRGEGDTAHDPSAMQRAAFGFFEKGVELRASDLHIRVSNRGRTEIRYRVHNDLMLYKEETAAFGQALANTIYMALADEADATFEPNSAQDARIGRKENLPQGLDGIRIATSPKVDGFLMVLRFLYDATGEGHDVAQLGYEEEQRIQIQTLKRRPTGINIVIGPTGSGKSTTLQRVLTSYIRETDGRKHVITVEDPPEYPIPGAVQTPVRGADTEEERSRAFQDAIKSAMRLDPDVIMIGEIRDTASARLAMQAAMTGHQVWATLHANGGFEAFDRMRDLGVEMPVLCNPSILSGLVAQRLVKKLCSCKRSYLDSAADLALSRGDDFMIESERFGRTFSDLRKLHVRGPGCEECRYTGVIGRTVVAEVIVTDRQMLDLVRRGETHEAFKYWKRKGGMTMMDHALSLVEAGIVDPFDTEEVVGDFYRTDDEALTPLRKVA